MRRDFPLHWSRDGAKTTRPCCTHTSALRRARLPKASPSIITSDRRLSLNPHCVECKVACIQAAS